MAFNWFKRQNEEDTTNASVNPENKEKSIPSANEDCFTSEDNASTSEISKDLLAFAKAAYSNIQEKKKLRLRLM
ncbi:hypothetical protein RINTHM_4590 [Richelia intracellularis HM01]|uniref:hypothetical protein n=1 Tax=Richelia intracellularis TaxID=1164990 RepID=UPI0002B57480|nr:hypothetical protein RINTHM_4590 [Richelia intracellularis HM01]